MTRTVAIIQARMASERLPGKILSPLAGQPLLGLLVGRTARARVDEWWLATSDEATDDVTEAWGFDLGLRVFRGHATDVLSRFLAIAEETGAEWLFRLTADNPFVDAPLIDLLVEARDVERDVLAKPDGTMFDGDDRGAESRAPSDLLRPAGDRPLGYGVELVRASALARASAAIPSSQPYHRVHVTSWLAVHGRITPVAVPPSWPARPDWRWTIDTYQDLAMARGAFRLFGADATRIDYPAMVARLDGAPEIRARNAHVTQKALEEG